jgi:hypothetical protein
MKTNKKNKINPTLFLRAAEICASDESIFPFFRYGCNAIAFLKKRMARTKLSQWPNVDKIMSENPEASAECKFLSEIYAKDSDILYSSRPFQGLWGPHCSESSQNARVLGLLFAYEMAKDEMKKRKS